MSEISADFPPSRTWPAILWTVAAAIALLLAQLLGLLSFLGWQALLHPERPQALHHLATNGAAISIITFTSSLVLLLVFLGFTRIRTRDVRLYLGLRLPALRDFMLGIAALVLTLAAIDLVSSRFSDPRALEFMRGMFFSAQRDHLLWLLVGAVTVAAPIGEEITFRGFLYKTIELRFGATAAVVVTALGWSVLHIQYGLASIASIFIIGLMLGAVRYFSRSLILTMILHGLWNSVAFLGSAMPFGKF
ncbi:MAG: lysostaphin resistance A-like protein [Rhizomicrobium sp.]